MKYVAFLRAINVGGHTVKMDHLRSVFQSMGFANVETFIASGNVIFDSQSKNSSALEKKIENELQRALSYEVKTFIRTPQALAQVLVNSGLRRTVLEQEGNILYVGFLSETPSLAAIKKLDTLADDINDIRVRDSEVYWLRRTGIGQSEYSGGLIEKTLNVPVTFRNVTTVKKLVAKYPS